MGNNKHFFYLKKLDVIKNINDCKILYQFTSETNPNWKSGVSKAFLNVGKSCPPQGTMSDFEYFRVTYKLLSSTEWFHSKEDYMLYSDGVAVTHIYTIARSERVIDISAATHIKHRQKGYALKATEEIEKILFNRSKVYFTTINDISETGAASKVAQRLGYIYNAKSDYWIKLSPKFELKRLDIVNDDSDLKILYDFTSQTSAFWKEQVRASLLGRGLSVPEQGEMSDFEYFKLVKTPSRKEKGIGGIKDYMLLYHGVAVTHIYTMNTYKNTVDIGANTHINHQRKGFALIATMAIEEWLLSDPEIYYVTITDISETGAASKVAQKLGYIFDPELGCFIKENPNSNAIKMLNEINAGKTIGTI